MRHEKITGPDQPSGEGPSQVTDGGAQRLATQIMDALEQGVVVWSKAGRCIMFNRRIFECIELEPAQLAVGIDLAAFMYVCSSRGDFNAAQMQFLTDNFKSGESFSYESVLPSGRIVAARVRPVRAGGCVLAFSDVTQERNAMRALDIARAEAEDAQRQATDVLNDERARQREEAHLAKLDGWLQSCKSLKELYQIVSAFMNTLLPATRGGLFIYSNSRDILELACAWNTQSQQDHITADSCWALRRGRLYIYEPDTFCFACDHVTDMAAVDALPGRFLCVPIVAHGDTVGLLHLAFTDDAANPDVLDPVHFATRSGEHISMAIANVKLRDELHDQSTRDSLTSLYNRRYFVDALNQALLVAGNHQANFALIAIDADKFKTFNDEHGHDAGDCVLEAIAETMRIINAPDAIACRVGGEEFSIILPNADRTRASTVAEELRLAISDTRVKDMGTPLPKVTISAGIAIYPTHGTDAKDLIKMADNALYAAKRAGRNCWRVAEGDGVFAFD